MQYRMMAVSASIMAMTMVVSAEYNFHDDMKDALDDMSFYFEGADVPYN